MLDKQDGLIKRERDPKLYEYIQDIFYNNKLLML